MYSPTTSADRVFVAFSKLDDPIPTNAVERARDVLKGLPRRDVAAHEVAQEVGGTSPT
jgi:hypothetical protein